MRALSLLLSALFTAIAQVAAGSNVVPYLPQAFFFDWNDQNIPLPNPTTAQCSTINIKWARGAATGPNNIPPYTLLVHTSAQTVPYIIDAGNGLQYNLTIPFAPGTQYEICMFDKNGNTGGCQAIYTVFPSNTTQCGSLALPSQTLDVQGVVNNGPISQYGWIEQCTDVSLTPKNGTPPFTMLVAPALHPPYKIMSNDMSPINWTVSLSWGSPFFLTLTDSNGLSWTNGPLHSGGGGSTTCLSTDPQPEKKSGLSVPVVVGSGVGGVVLGAIVGIIIASCFARNRYGKVRRNSSTDSIDQAAYIANQERFKRTEAAPHSPNTPGPDMVNNQYLVEPFLPEGHHHPTSPTHNTMPPAPTSAYSNTQSDGSAGGTQPAPHVYVVHHDGGGAPVTVFTGGGGVTELPPSYVGRPEDQPTIQPAPGGSGNNPEPMDRRPRPGPTPRKSQPGFQ